MKALERMEEVAPVHADSPYHLVIEQPEKMSTPIMSLDHASIGYDGTAVLTDVHQTILPGARIGVLGENGAGKSTLLKCLVGDLPTLAGERVTGAHSKVGYFAQHQLESLHAERTALQTLQLARPAWREQQCRDYLGTWGFPKEKLERSIVTLSGGEKARLVLALIAGERPALLVLDEPTNHLDLDMRDALAMALQDFEGALIIVAHDRSMLARTVDEYWLVEGGTVSRLQTDLAGYTDTHNPAGTKTTTAGRESDSRDRADNGAAEQTTDRKAQRRAAAERRAEEKPLRDSIRKLEKSMESLTAELKTVEAQLADTETYQNLPPAELDDLLKTAARLRSRRDDAETLWLEHSEKLEALRETAAR